MSQELMKLVTDYLQVRRALGHKLEGPEILLIQFVGYLEERHADTLTIEHALGFATAPAGASARWQALRLSAIRCFARWAVTSDPSIQVPPGPGYRRPTRPKPYIYSQEQIGALLAAASRLRPPIRAATFPLIALMAATGLHREALALDVTSVDWDAATLRVIGKYGKIRLLPLHPSVLTGLTDYREDRRRLLPAHTCPALFISATAQAHPAPCTRTSAGWSTPRGSRPRATPAVPGYTTCGIPSPSRRCWTPTAPAAIRPPSYRFWRRGWGTPIPQIPTGT